MSAIPVQPLPTGAQKWVITAGLLLGFFTYAVNSRGSVLESPVIVQAFALDHYKVQWITGIEGIFSLASLFTSLYFLKLFGNRRTYLIGAICLASGCLGMCLAADPYQLGAFGALRHGAGFMAVPGSTLIRRILPDHKRFAYCLYAALVYGGQVAAESLGALVAFKPSWQALFIGLSALGVCLSLVALFLFPHDRPERQPAGDFDVAGAALFVIVMGLIFFLLYRGNYLGWRVSTWIWIGGAALVAALTIFIWRELTAPEPFLNLRAFASRTVALSMIASGFWCAALYGTAVQLANCLLTLGYEHEKTGWVLAPMTLILLAVMILTGLVSRRDWYVWLFRAGLAGMTVVGLWLSCVDIYTPWQWVMGVSCLWALFAGLCMAPIAQLIFEGQPPQVSAETGGMKFFMRSYGGTVGILLAGILIDQGAWSGLEFVRGGIVRGQGAVQADVPTLEDHLARHGSTPASAETQAQAVLGQWVNLHAQVIGYRLGLRCCAYLSAAGLLVSFFISGRKEFSTLDPA